jgi:hypothetical protein
MYVQSGVNDCDTVVQKITQLSADYIPASRGMHCTKPCWYISSTLFLDRKIVLCDAAEPPASRRIVDSAKNGKSTSNP